MKIKFVLIGILIFLFQCSKENDTVSIDKCIKLETIPKAQKNWNYKKINNNTYLQPPKIKLLNDRYLIVVTKSKNNIIEVYDVEKERIIQKLGNAGSGPGEFMGIFDILCNDYEEKFIIYDIVLARLTQYKKNEEDKFILDKIIKISLDAGTPSKFVVVDNKFVATGMFSSRLCYYNKMGDTLNTNNYIVGNQKDGASNVQHFFAYKGQVEYNNISKKIIVSNFHADLLEIYSKEGKIIKLIHGPDFFIPDYSIVNNVVNFKNKRRGYNDICLTSNKIYGLYSGKLHTEDWTSDFTNVVFVFDYNGNIIDNISTNFKLVNIEIDKKHNMVYSICFNGNEFFIGSYKL